MNLDEMTTDDWIFYQAAFRDKPYIYQRIFRLMETEMVLVRHMDRELARRILQENLMVRKDSRSFYVLQFFKKTLRVASAKKNLVAARGRAARWLGAIQEVEQGLFLPSSFSNRKCNIYKTRTICYDSHSNKAAKTQKEEEAIGLGRQEAQRIHSIRMQSKTKKQLNTGPHLRAF